MFTRREAVVLLGVGALGLLGRPRRSLAQSQPTSEGATSFVELGKLHLAYRSFGVGDPVLLLHGQGGNGDSWDKQVAALSSRFQVVTVDMRGHGGSSVLKGPYTISQFSQDAAGLCRALFQKPAHVIGHSLGGMVALSLALEEPALVKSLSIINSTANAEKGASKFKDRLVRGYIKVFGMKSFAKRNARLHFPNDGQEALRERLISVMGSAPEAGYLASQHAVSHFNESARLRQIGCPVLVVHSAQDVIPIEDKTELATSVKNGRMVTIEDSHHVVLWDQPEKLNKVLVDFLLGAAK